MVTTPTLDAAGHRSAPVCSDPAAHGPRCPVIFLSSECGEYVASAEMPFDEYLALDWEEGLAEWVDGKVYLYVSAMSYHQRVVTFLTTHLSMVLTFLGLGTVHLAPYAMKSPSGRSGREPDLFAVRTEHRERILPHFFDGAPDLIVEVVSTDSVLRDRVEKLAEYAGAGVPEYWIVDPRPGVETAKFYLLDAESYREASPDPEGIYASPTFPGLKLRPEWLFMEDPPLAEALALCLGPGFGMAS